MPAEGTGRVIGTSSTPDDRRGTPDGRASTDALAAVVFAGGDPVDAAVAAELPSGALVIAADSGLYQARRLGCEVQVAVGDFDSVTDEDLRSLGPDVEVERHPTAKDMTDIELGLEAARVRGAAAITVVAGAGGRLDHALANLLVLGASAYAGIDVRAWIGDARVQVVRGRRRLSGSVGDTVSLLALGGVARGVETSGLRYRLDGEALQPGSTRGISNVFEQAVAEITVREGCLLAVQPAAEDDTERTETV